MKKVLVAMSGGVDSAVAAFLLKKQGYEVSGVFLNFWKEKGVSENRCCSLRSRQDAKKVAKHLGIKFYTFNFAHIFKKKVVDDFIKHQLNGLTPNPCIACNKFIKLGYLLKKASQLGYDYVATGHYLRKKLINGSWQVYQAIDQNKDQSYFLYNLTQAKLKHLLFPIGEFKKTEVRALARKNKITVYNNPESQDICFIPDDDVVGFLRRNAENIKVGLIVDEGGKTIGHHRGLPFYTIGQREGLGIGGKNGPYYVVGKKLNKNQLIVTNNPNSPNLWQTELTLKSVNWVSEKEPKLLLNVQAKIRYRSRAELATVKKSNGKLIVTFQHKARAITPGQSAVFYKGNQLLGGGIIV